jgi:hypothetical protein
MGVTVRSAALLLALGAAACGRIGLPAVDLPGAGASNRGTERLVENKVWLEESGPPGAFLAFVADGTLVAGSCERPARLGAWRWVDEATLVWEENGARTRAEVGVVGPDTLVLMQVPVGETPPVRFRAAQTPVACPA